MAAVRSMRLASPKVPTQKQADTPYLFAEIRQSDGPYLLIPSVSSERRQYVPIGYLPADVIASNLVFMLPDAGLYEFGILGSALHNAWMRSVCGRLKSDYRYSNTIVYNNFPWPTADKAQREKVCQAAQAVLDARALEEERCAAQGQSCSLADLYAPGNMPRELLKAHEQLDRAVDTAYASDGFKVALRAEADRVAFLLSLYQLRAVAD